MRISDWSSDVCSSDLVAADVAGLVGRYDIVNIKLDKTGGLTEAVRLLRAAQTAGLDTMVGCMKGTSLPMAPALMLPPHSRFVDPDAQLRMGPDRSTAPVYRADLPDPPAPALVGHSPTRIPCNDDTPDISTFSFTF